MKKIGFLSILVSIFLISPVIYLKQQSVFKTGFSIYLNRNIFRIEKANFLNIELMLPQDYESNLYSQTIQESSYYIRLSPPTTKEKEIKKDEFGNKILSVKWNKIRSCSIEIQLNGLVTYDYNIESLNDPFPVKSDLLDKDKILYLNPTEYIQPNSDEISKIANAIAKDENLEFRVIYKIILWTLSNINYLPDSNYLKSQDVLLHRGGNREGILHLMISLLRSLYIPVKATVGYIFQDSFKFKDNFIFKYEKGIYTLLEVYFPSIGWVYIDPFNFFITPAVTFVKFGSGLDFMSLKFMKFDTDVENPLISETFVFEIVNSIHKIMGNIENNFLFNSFTIFAPSIVNQYNFKDLSFKNIELESENNTSENKKNLQNDKKLKIISYHHNENFIEISGNENYYYQPITFKHKVKLKSIYIPMVKMNDAGVVGIYVYKSENGKIGTFVNRTYFRKIKYVSYGSFKINDLYFKLNFKDMILEPGEYFFRIVTSGTKNNLIYYGMNYMGGNKIKSILYFKNGKIRFTNFNLIFKLTYEIIE